MTDTENDTGARAPLAAVPMFAATLLLGGCAQMPFPPLDSLLAGTASDASDTTAGEPVDDSVEETADAIPEPQEDPEPGKLYDWTGNGRNVTRIVIDTNEQKARVYSGNEQVGWTVIASGVSKHPTPRGEFAILEKVKDKRSNLYGKIVNSRGKVIKASATGKDPIPAGARFVGARMPNFMRMTYDGIGMHAGPIPRPGHPASHGCIRMPSEFAAALFAHASHGTAVTVVGNGPDYGNYAERVARQQAEERARRAAAEAAREGSPLDGLDAEVAVMREADAGDAPPRSGAQAPAETAGRGQPAEPEGSEPTAAPPRTDDSERAAPRAAEMQADRREEPPAPESAPQSVTSQVPEPAEHTQAQAPAQDGAPRPPEPRPDPTAPPANPPADTSPVPQPYYPPPAAAPRPPYPYYPASPTGIRSTGDATGWPGLG
jgi:lipoprotein-anchoring transpeptidase ErfK/SrfK